MAIPRLRVFRGHRLRPSRRSGSRDSTSARCVNEAKRRKSHSELSPTRSSVGFGAQRCAVSKISRGRRCGHTNETMSERNFFAELKRRNVYKVAVAYAVVAWLLIQAASILFPTFEAPPWVMKVFVAVIVLGFPIALVFSWAFEITPEGIKREEEVLPNDSITHHTGRKIVGITIVVAAIATGLFIFQLLRPRLTNTGGVSAAVQALPEKSVAVHAFDNLSDDKGSEYFSDGISEELLTVLQKIPGLRVAARTSSFSFKGKSATAQEIGQKLGV